MTYADTYLTDRSRFEDGNHCNMKRYLRFHSGPHGRGIVRKALAMPLITGSQVHECLADLLLYNKGGNELSEVAQRLVVTRHTEGYRQMIAARGFDTEEEDVAILLKEQQVLLAGLVFSWVRVATEGDFFNEWSFEHIEQEFNLEFASGKIAMIRPDLVPRHIRTKAVTVLDWKTAAYVNDNYIQEWSVSPQMMLQATAVARGLGEEVKDFYVWGMNKGMYKHDYNPNTGEWDGPMRQQSFLVWAYHNEGTPPFIGPEWRPDRKYPCEDWKSCTIVRGKSKGHPHNHMLPDNWEKKMVVDPYAWVQQLPIERLRSIHNLLGPYEVNPYKVEQLLRTLTANEGEWQHKLDLLRYERSKWESEEHQNVLDALFPRSYKCHSYGRRCAYYDLCFKQTGWQDPLGAGFIPRRPHHQQEIDQMIELGIPVPSETGEEEEVSE